MALIMRVLEEGLAHLPQVPASPSLVLYSSPYCALASPEALVSWVLLWLRAVSMFEERRLRVQLRLLGSV